MTFEQFHNALRVLRSIDSHDIGDPEWWRYFCDHPTDFFLSCDDERASIIWAAMKKRMPADTDAELVDVLSQVEHDAAAETQKITAERNALLAEGVRLREVNAGLLAALKMVRADGALGNHGRTCPLCIQLWTVLDKVCTAIARAEAES